MLKWRCAGSCLALATGLALAFHAPHAQASQDAAKRYFQNGVDLITGPQPNYQDAYYQFQLAYQESSKSWKVLGNMGLCALKLERDGEAVSYYEQYLEKGGADIATEERNAIEQDLFLLKGNLATVHLSSSVAELKLIDQRSGSSVPAQPYALQGGQLELRLRAGTHSIAALSGDRRVIWDVVLEPKADVAHVFDFEAPGATGPSTVVAKPTSSPSADRRSSAGAGLRWAGYAALGLGAVGMGAGGYFVWQSSDYASKSDAAFACDRQPRGCSSAQKNDVRSFEAQSSDAKTRAGIMFGLGGAAIASGIVLLIVAPSSASSGETHGAQLAPWVGYRSAGVVGRF